MSEAFDTGPLSWVKDEIDQSLSLVKDRYLALSSDENTVDSLQVALSHLQQVQGALDMIGLEGAQRFVQEVIEVTEQVINQSLVADQGLIDVIATSINGLQQYLNELMQGAQDLPLRLYPLLSELATLQDIVIDKTALFYPDTSFRPPSDLPSRQTPSTSLPLFIGEQRIRFQKSLIDWLLNKDDVALQAMQSALQAVQAVQEKPLQVSLWWSASTLMECLKQSAIADLPGAKKLCRKLDQQLRDQATGEHKRAQSLLKEVLYYVGLSNSTSDEIQRVKDTFELDALLNESAMSPLTTGQEDNRWADVQQAYQANLPKIKNCWEQLTEVLWHEEVDFNIDLALMDELLKHSESLIRLADQFSQAREESSLWNDVMSLSDALASAYKAINGMPQLLTERLALAVASTLAMQERFIKEPAKHGPEQQQAASSQVSRLNQLLNAESELALPETSQPYEDDEVTRAVAQQVVECLVIVEKSVDRFFRSPNVPDSLNDAFHQLKPVVAAFDMLEMSTPKTIAKLCVIYLEQFSANSIPEIGEHPNHSQFEVVAEGISLLGLFAHDLPDIRSEVKQAMADNLQALEQGMDRLIVDERDQVEYSEELDDRRQEDRREVGRLAAIQEVREAEEIEITASYDPKTDDAATQKGSPADKDKPIFNLTPVVERAADDELQSIFIVEAEELLEYNRLNLAALRANSSNEVALVEVRRAYHTLKGSGRTVGLEVLAEVAYSIEKLLNVLLEHNISPSKEIIDFVSLCNQSFLGWVETLKDNGQVTLNAGEFQQQAAEMADLLQQSLQSVPPQAKKEEVLIGGSRKVGRAFFYLFLGEAQQHLNTLIAARKAIKEGSMAPPSVKCRRAAHTLSSNALTAGFDAIGDLSRALENWFDEFYGPWTEKHLSLFSKVINALKDGLEKAKNLEHPKSTRALIIELSKTTAAMQVQATQLSEPAETHLVKGLSDEERLGTGLSADEITVSRMTDDDLDEGSIEDEALPLAESIEVEALEGVEADRVRFSLKPPAFLPEEAMEEVVDAFNFDPDEDDNDEVINPAIEIQDEPKVAVEQYVQPAQVVSTIEAIPQPSKPEIVQATSTALKESIAEPIAKSKQDWALDNDLVMLFIEEASELLPKIGQQLRSWKEVPSDVSLKHSLQRDLHTLKGSARTAGQMEVGDQAHALEDKLEFWISKAPTLNDFDAFFVDYDRICLLLEELRTKQTKLSEDELEETQEDSDHLTSQDDQAITIGQEQHEHSLTSPYLRVRASQLDQLISESGEVSILRSRLEREVHGLKEGSKDLTLSVSRLRTYLNDLQLEADSQLQSRMTELKEADSEFDPLELDQFTRLQELTRLMAESLHDISTIQQGLISNIDQADMALIQQNRMNRDLQKGLMTVRMMPFSIIAERLHRIVRQISRELDKKVNLTIIGEEVELDRGVLEQIGAPLEHLLRNAIVHGIEEPAERLALGKAEEGEVTLAVTAVDEEIKLTVNDDGKGIDLNQIQSLAMEQGHLNETQSVSNESLISVLFEPGFTTKHAVSQNAGRGIGLDAVKSEIAALNGRIDVTNNVGHGLTFDIFLPVSLSVTQVLIVGVKGQQYAIPTAMIEQVQTLKQQALEQAYVDQSISWNEHRYPLHCFATLLGDTDYVAKNQVYTPMIFLRSGQSSAVLHVDEVVGNQEIVMKPMGTQLSKVPGIIGASVLGDGAIVFVVSPMQLAQRQVIKANTPIKKSVPIERVKKLALVVDDSLTMRKALSRILEKDGMAVVTANDGLDAIQKLDEFQPDVVLTDIEMPRMDGFEFAKQLRESEKTKSLPLVMISSRSAQKHHEHAKAVGVNAFLGKPVQDEVLLKAVHTLVPN